MARRIRLAPHMPSVMPVDAIRLPRQGATRSQRSPRMSTAPDTTIAKTAPPLPKPSDPKLRHMANALRALAMDAVEKANSGHPGLPMGMADVATVLWSKFLKFDAADPAWPDRDRFVLSAGHGSMLLY